MSDSILIEQLNEIADSTSLFTKNDIVKTIAKTVGDNFIVINRFNTVFTTEKSRKHKRQEHGWKIDVHSKKALQCTNIADLIKAKFEGLKVSGFHFYIDDERDLSNEASKTYIRQLEISMERN